MIAALLTLVGYSVNDTIVIFDRVRENLAHRRKDPLDQILNDSLNQTLTRTIISNGTTFLAVLGLFLFGGEVLRGFGFAMVVGIIVGTYSTLFIAVPLVSWWYDRQGGGGMGLRARAPAPAKAPAKVEGDGLTISRRPATGRPSLRLTVRARNPDRARPRRTVLARRPGAKMTLMAATMDQAPDRRATRDPGEGLFENVLVESQRKPRTRWQKVGQPRLDRPAPGRARADRLGADLPAGRAPGAARRAGQPDLQPAAPPPPPLPKGSALQPQTAKPELPKPVAEKRRSSSRPRSRAAVPPRPRSSPSRA